MTYIHDKGYPHSTHSETPSRDGACALAAATHWQANVVQRASEVCFSGQGRRAIGIEARRARGARVSRRKSTAPVDSVPTWVLRDIPKSGRANEAAAGRVYLHTNSTYYYTFGA